MQVRTDIDRLVHVDLVDVEEIVGWISIIVGSLHADVLSGPERVAHVNVPE